MVVVLLNNKIFVVNNINPVERIIRADLTHTVILTFARKSIGNDCTLYIGTAEKTDCLVEHRSNPIRVCVIINFKIRGVKKCGWILKSQMTDKFFVKKFRRRIFDTAAEFFNAVNNGYILTDKVGEHICRQTVLCVVKPLENIGIFKICNSDRMIFVIDLS